MINGWKIPICTFVTLAIILISALFPASTSGWVTSGPTWSGRDTTMSLNLGTDAWNNSAEAALYYWNEVVGSNFMFYYNYTSRDRCDRGWACIGTDGNAVAWDDFSNGVCDDPASGALAITRTNWIINYCNADVLFNNQYTWTTGDPGWTTGPPYSFNTVAIHEFGHALGLAHENRWLATMNSIYHPFPWKIHADDMDGIRNLYSSSGTVTDIGVTNWKKVDGNVETAAQLVASPTSATPGQTFSMEVTVENYSTSAKTFNNRLYLSTNNVITTSDTPIGTYHGASLSAGWLATWNYNVTIPSATPTGTYWLGICVDYDNALAESNENNNCLAHPRSITITCPTPSTPSLVSPANGATCVIQNPILDWSDVSGATLYEVQVCSDSGCATVVRSATPAVSQQTVTPALSSGTQYWWRTRARNTCQSWSTWSSIRGFTTLYTPPIPSTVSPSSGATGVSTTPLLDWTDSAGATSYEVQVCNNNICSSVARSAIPTISQWTVSPALSYATQYWWRARASACGQNSSWTGTRDFTTVVPVPAAPSLVSPANGATGVTTTPVLDWTDSAYATSYDVQVCSDSGCATVVRSATPTASVWTVSPALTNNTLYYWRARARNVSGNSAWTGTWSFTTIPSFSKLYMGVKGATNNNLYIRKMSGGAWDPWETISGATSHAPAMAAFNNRLYMAVKGETNNNLYLRYMDNTGAWSSWSTIPGGTTLSPAVVSFNNRLYLFVKGATNDSIYYRSMDTSGAWSSWFTVPGGATSQTPTVAVLGSDLWLFAKGATNNNLYFNRMNTSGIWAGWVPLTEGGTNVAPSLVLFGDKLYLFVKGATNNNIYYLRHDWASWAVLDGATTRTPSLSVNPEDGMLYIAVKGADNNNIYYRRMDAGGTWSSWFTMTGATSDTPVLGAY